MLSIARTKLLIVCFSILICLPFKLRGQTFALPKTIGHLDSKDILVFEGNHTFTKDDICTTLYSDKDVILAISPTASLKDYLSVLESKIRLGYLHEGFISSKVQVSYIPQPEQLPSAS